MGFMSMMQEFILILLLVMGNKKKKHAHSHAHKRSPNQTAYFPPVDQEQLVAQALALHPLLSNRTASLRKLETYQLCYVISTKWLKEWKEYVGYALVTGDEDEEGRRDKKFGKRHPGRINSDITASVSETRDFYTLPAELKGYEYLGEVLGEKKAKNDDYIAVTEQIWNAFLQHYEGQPIRRPVHSNKSRTFYDTQLLIMDVIFVNLEDFEELEIKIKETPKKNYCTILPSDKLQFPTIWSYDDLHEYLTRFVEAEYKQNKIRIWKGHSYIATNPLVVGLVESIKAKTFVMQGRELSAAKYENKDIDDYLKTTHTLIVEIGEVFLPEEDDKGEAVFGYCEECIEKKKLPVVCVCGEIHYCSRRCRNDDQPFHFRTCKGAFDSSDDQSWDKIKTIEHPRGGLQNLGNTCYMNSSLQALLSIPHISRFFTSNEYFNFMSQKQHDEHKCMLLRKFSKAAKALAEEKIYTPWPLKAQIDYNLHPFIGYGQHDAYEFTINFINAVNDQLRKQGDEAHHTIFKPMAGAFNSKVTCPHCQVQSETNDVFMQVTLPIKEKTHQKMYSYIVVEKPTLIRRGKALIVDNWDSMRENVEAVNSVVGMLKENVAVMVDEDQSPQKITKTGKTIIYYVGMKVNEAEMPFSFGTVNNQIMFTLRHEADSPDVGGEIYDWHFLVTYNQIFLLSRYNVDKDIIEQTDHLQKQFVRMLEQLQKEPEKQEKSNEQDPKEEKLESEEVSTEAQTQQDIAQQINEHLTASLADFAKKIGIQVYIHDGKRRKGVCRFCRNKCASCDLPKTFNESLSAYLGDKAASVDFEVYLSKSLQVKYIDRNMGVVGDPGLKDCLQLFTEPQQLDQQNAFYCMNCDSMGLALKQLHINTFPPLLVIHLNRFKTVFEKKIKNSEPIQYSKIEQFGGNQYRLLAVVVHEGGMEGGHYWSIGLRGDKYYVFNDAKVSPVEEIFNKNAYLLIYQRCDFEI